MIFEIRVTLKTGVYYIITSASCCNLWMSDTRHSLTVLGNLAVVPVRLWLGQASRWMPHCGA